MKKLILIIIAIFGMINISSAQDSENDFREKLQFGVKLGANYSNVFDTKGEDFVADPKFGFVFGGFVAIPIGKYIGIQPELLFSQKGFKATGVLLGSTYELKRTTTYIDVPILFALKPIEYLTLLAGPQYSYLIKQTDAFANTTTSILQEQTFENDNIRRNTFGFIFGADLNYSNLVIGGRVGWDILNNNGDGTSTTPRYKNVWYQFTLGYRFF